MSDIEEDSRTLIEQDGSDLLMDVAMGRDRSLDDLLLLLDRQAELTKREIKCNVICCNDCRNFVNTWIRGNPNWCTHHVHETKPDCYCSWAVKRDE